jgi:HSP20 family molecular chaperone IbpA
MTRVSLFSSPYLLGFDDFERIVDRAAKSANDGYPPYNIERVARAENSPEKFRITLAVAGFSRDELEITIEENQLMIRGRQVDDGSGPISIAALPPASSSVPLSWRTVSR